MTFPLPLFPVFDALAQPQGEPVALDAPAARWTTLAARDAGPVFLPPVRGSVYGTLLNHAGTLAALGDQVHAAPYKAPPQAPVLYIKPRNTLAGHRQPVAVPADVAAFEIGATLGVVIGRTCCAVRAADAVSYVAGYTVVNDLTVPHSSFYRPSLRFKVRDGSCPLGPAIVAARHVVDPDALAVTVRVDGVVVQRTSTGDRVRNVATLIAAVSDFMTLHPGDVLTIGVAAGAAQARAGQRVDVAIEGVGVLETPLVKAPS